VNRYALTFPVRAGSEAAVAEILGGYSGPPPGRPQAARPLLGRTSVFMAGPTVVRVVDITCPPHEAIRHLTSQPQIRAVEERLRPHLVEDRDLSDEDSRRRFLSTAVMRVVAQHGGPTHHAARTAVLYEAAPGAGSELARMLAEQDLDTRGVTVFRRRDLVVHLVEGPDDVPAVLPPDAVIAHVRSALPMTLVTDRIVERVS
jgi:hypothetical protein